MRSTRRLALGASILASLAIVGTAGGGAIVSAQDQPTVRIGSDGFYESQLMAEIYAQALEAEGFERRPPAGHRHACRPRSRPSNPGQIDLVPEYVGSGLGFYTRGLGEPGRWPRSRSAATARPTAPICSRRSTSLGVDATVLAITAGEDTNAAVVRADTAEELGLSQHQRPGRGRRPADLRPAARVRGQRRSAAVRSRTATASPGRRPSSNSCPPAMHRWPAPSRATPSTWPGSARRSRPSPRTAGSCSKTTSTHSRPRTSRRSCATTSWRGSTVVLRPSLPSSIPSLPAITTEVLTDLGVRVAVDQEDIEDVAAEFLASLAG